MEERIGRQFAMVLVPSRVDVGWPVVRFGLVAAGVQLLAARNGTGTSQIWYSYMDQVEHGSKITWRRFYFFIAINA